MFKLYANKNQLTVRQREPLTSGSVNAYTALFEFSDDWTGMARVAVFQSAAGPPVPVLLDETGICTIPWETLTKPYVQLKVGVRGTIGGEIVLPTIWANLGTILDGVSGGGNPDPTPDLLEQKLATKGDALKYDGTNLSLMSGEKALSTVQVSGGFGGGMSDLPTIKNVFVDNISHFDGIKFPCCVHLVNAVLGYTFQNDIVYVSTDGEVLTVVTIDNATVTMSIDPKTGTLDILKASRLEPRLEMIEEDIRHLSQTGGGGMQLEIGSGLKIVDGELTVNTTDDFKGDNTLPMTAAGVETVVGNIEALLSTI